MFKSRGSKQKFFVQVYFRHAQVSSAITNEKAPTYCKLLRGSKTYQTSACVPSEGQAIWNETIRFPTTLFLKKGLLEPKVFQVEIHQEANVLYTANIDFSKYADPDAKSIRTKTVELKLKRKHKVVGNLLLLTVMVGPKNLENEESLDKIIKKSLSLDTGSARTIKDLPSFGVKVDLEKSFANESTENATEEGKTKRQISNILMQPLGGTETGTSSKMGSGRRRRGKHRSKVSISSLMDLEGGDQAYPPARLEEPDGPVLDGLAGSESGPSRQLTEGLRGRVVRMGLGMSSASVSRKSSLEAGSVSGQGEGGASASTTSNSLAVSERKRSGETRAKSGILNSIFENVANDGVNDDDDDPDARRVDFPSQGFAKDLPRPQARKDRRISGIFEGSRLQRANSAKFEALFG